MMATGRRTVRLLDIDAADSMRARTAVDDMYNDVLDVLVVRKAFDPKVMEAVGTQLDRGDRNPGWARPNERMPVEDIQILGTDTPATPTYSSPRGASLDDYLASAARHGAAASSVFEGPLDPNEALPRVLGGFAAGRPVEVPRAADGRAYVPFTIRRLVDGKQIGPHHDYHYKLSLYEDLAPRLDTRTLVSFVVTMLAPERGGELIVYGVTPQTPDPPKLANGFSWDVAAVEQRFDSATVVTAPGDLFLLASGRCLHRVSPIGGPTARVTMGGFLALDRDGDRVYCWS